MTQAFNLAQLANKVNTSGQLDASTGLVNAVPVANGGLALNAIAARSIPLANVANTYTALTPAAGQSIRINAGNTAWEAFTPGTGTVSSVATGNGLAGGTITTTGTLTLGNVAFNTIGAYVFGAMRIRSNFTTVAGNTYAAGSGSQQVMTAGFNNAGTVGAGVLGPLGVSNNLSGTWRLMSGGNSYVYCSCSTDQGTYGIFVRVA